MTAQAGPFTDYWRDEPIVKYILEWIGGDWVKLRSILNYTHDTGMLVQAKHETNNAKATEQGLKFRIDNIHNLKVLK